MDSLIGDALDTLEVPYSYNPYNHGLQLPSLWRVPTAAARVLHNGGCGCLPCSCNPDGEPYCSCRLTAALQETGMRENTIVSFIGDHGPLSPSVSPSKFRQTIYRFWGESLGRLCQNGQGTRGSQVPRHRQSATASLPVALRSRICRACDVRTPT